MADGTLDWLMEGDAAIRWQILRDLGGETDLTVQRERRRMTREGWARKLLDEQGADGRWAGGAAPDTGLYSPKWTSTTYTLLLLRDFGLAPGAKVKKACKLLLDRGMQPDGGVNYGTWARWVKQSETCVTGMVLSLVAYFELEDERRETLVEHLLEQQMDDGGWNCRRRVGRRTPQ